MRRKMGTAICHFKENYIISAPNAQLILPYIFCMPGTFRAPAPVEIVFSLTFSRMNKNIIRSLMVRTINFGITCHELRTIQLY